METTKAFNLGSTSLRFLTRASTTGYHGRRTDYGLLGATAIDYEKLQHRARCQC